MNPPTGGAAVRPQHIIAAVDETEAGDQAARTAFAIASRSSGKVGLLHVITAPVRPQFRRFVPAEGAVLLEEDTCVEERVRHRIEQNVLLPGGMAISLNVAFGVPGIEICRFSEECEGDLIVMGRKTHSERARLLLGDTVDAVARRSSIPTLFVPQAGTRLDSILVALDGSERGMRVLDEACTFAHAVGAALRVMTVEAMLPGESREDDLPLTRSASLQARATEALARRSCPEVPVVIRRGGIVAEVLKEVQAGSHDVLAIGHHRGGPGWLVQSSSTAQQLGHAAPCAVLIIPL
jgi:nucleotide-binding universal stress UspA family protein